MLYNIILNMIHIICIWLKIYNLFNYDVVVSRVGLFGGRVAGCYSLFTLLTKMFICAVRILPLCSSLSEVKSQKVQ